MIRGFIVMAAASIVALATAPARAELTLCNRTSYRMETAIGLEKRANVATRGWFVSIPDNAARSWTGRSTSTWSTCTARTPPVYGSAPLPQAGQAEFCIRDGDFDIAKRARLPDKPAGRISTRRSRRTRRKDRSSIWRKKPIMTMRRHGSPASSGCW